MCQIRAGGANKRERGLPRGAGGKKQKRKQRDKGVKICSNLEQPEGKILVAQNPKLARLARDVYTQHAAGGLIVFSLANAWNACAKACVCVSPLFMGAWKARSNDESLEAAAAKYLQRAALLFHDLGPWKLLLFVSPR